MHRLQDFSVLYPEIFSRKLRGHRPMQEYGTLALKFARGYAFLVSDPQKFFLAHFSRRVVQKGSQARFFRVEAVELGETFDGVGHAQGVGIALLREALASVASSGVEKVVVDHDGDCRIKACKTRRRTSPQQMQRGTRRSM